MVLTGGMELNGRYRLEQPLGRGLAEVWRAADSTLGRAVAVKVMPALAAEAGAAGRSAAQAAATLQHPGITVVHDIGEYDGRLFVVTQLLPGQDLNQVLHDSEDGLAPDRAAAIGARIAEALAEAHSRGIVHRGLKPSNVMLLSADQAKICDFGIAETLQAAADELGAMAGSPAFMAPEQFSGEVDHRTDLYALGCILYALATGNPPFAADQPWPALMYQQVNTEPADPRTRKAELPAQFAELILALLEKEPGRRPQTAADVVKQLSAFAATPQQLEPDPAQPEAAAAEAVPAESVSAEPVSAEPAPAEAASTEPTPAEPTPTETDQPPPQVQLTPLPAPAPEPVDAPPNPAFAAPTVATPFAPPSAPGPVYAQPPRTASIGHGRAVELMQRAAHSVGRIVDSERTLAALCAVVQNFATVDPGQAQAVFDGIEISPVPQYDAGGDAQVARLLAALVTGLGPAGRGTGRGMLDEAAGFARSKSLTPHAAALALSAVAAPTLWYDRERARGLLARAERHLPKVVPGPGLDEALKAVAIPFASLDAGFAGQIAVRIVDPALSVSAHVRIADRVAAQSPAYAVSFLNVAQQRLAGLTDPRIYEARAADIAVRFAGLDFGRAQQLVPADEDRNRLHSARALAALSAAALRWDAGLSATYMDSAVHDAMATVDDIDRSRALAGLGAALAASAPERARSLLSDAHRALKDVADPHRRAYALCHLVACGLGMRPDDGWNAGAES